MQNRFKSYSWDEYLMITVEATTLGAEIPPISLNQVINGPKHTVKSGEAVFSVDVLVLVGILVTVILFNSF